jgi:hypothetical protein
MLTERSPGHASVARFSLRAGLAVAVATFGLSLTIASPASAQNLVANPTFAISGGTTSFAFGGYAPYGGPSNESLAGWTYVPSGTGSSNTGAGFDFANGTTTAYYAGSTAQILPIAITAPAGGNFVGFDANWGGATQPTGISQTIYGLTPGVTYTLSFAWAESQWYNYTGSDTVAWTASLGGTSQSTSPVTIPSQGFSGWMTQTFNFVANSSSEPLSFLATSASGQPPLALLANVSLAKAPEPMSVVLFGTGVIGLMAATRKRRLTAPGR